VVERYLSNDRARLVVIPGRTSDESCDYARGPSTCGQVASLKMPVLMLRTR
jgi:hypothetical protein